MPLPFFDKRGLLPPGVHLGSEEDLFERCVQDFQSSKTRPTIFWGFKHYRTKLTTCALNLMQWIDGSFVDQTRIDPEDVDLLNLVSPDEYNKIAPNRRPYIATILQGRETTKPEFKAHTFLLFWFAEDHPLRPNTEANMQYWIEWFSTPQDYSGLVKKPAPTRGKKGIVKMYLGDIALCPDVDGHG